MEPSDNRYSTDLTSPAKPAVDNNHNVAGQSHALAIVVKHQKSRELTAAYRIRALKDSLTREQLDNHVNAIILTIYRLVLKITMPI